MAAVREARFRVMGSAAHMALVDPTPGAEDFARERLAELERRWSRFLDTSELSRLNEAPGAMLVVSADTLTLVTTMREAWHATGGRYDPTMLREIAAAGYAVSADDLGRVHAVDDGGADRPRRTTRPTLAAVAVDPLTSTATVPAGAGLDAGGIGKGLAADLVVTELLARGTGGALVSVGGDVACAGAAPWPDGWRVAVEDPWEPATKLTTLALEAGGVATSSTVSRTWRAAGVCRHHALDPVTGGVSGTDLAAVTVAARAGWEAEAHATAALLCGSAGVLEYLCARDLSGVAVTGGGAVLTTPDLTPARPGERSVA